MGHGHGLLKPLPHLPGLGQVQGKGVKFVGRVHFYCGRPQWSMSTHACFMYSFKVF